MADRLTEKVAIVTGAASGIGRAAALRLAAEGCRVTVADIRQEQAEETAELIREKRREAIAVPGDVSKETDVACLVEETISAWGGIDILVNNAGVGSAAFIESVSDEEIERVLGINLVGVIRVTRKTVPFLKASVGGRIVNISSAEGIRGSGLLPLYSASKAGVIGMTRANAIELARNNITVNAICPGPIQTAMLAPLVSDEQYRQKILKGVPMRRLGTPEDVAAAVAFFASPETSFITGNVLVVDGGMTVKTL